MNRQARNYGERSLYQIVNKEQEEYKEYEDDNGEAPVGRKTWRADDMATREEAGARIRESGCRGLGKRQAFM